MSTAKTIEKLESYGYTIALLPDGQISIKFPPWRTKPEEGPELIQQCKDKRDSVAFFLKARADGFKLLPVHSIIYDDYKDAIAAFEHCLDDVEIINVFYYRTTGEVEVQFRLLVLLGDGFMNNKERSSMNDLVEIYELFEPIGANLFCMLVDYKDKDGNDFHRPLQTIAFKKDDLSQEVRRMVEDEGFTVAAITLYPGRRTIDELYLLADGIGDLSGREVLYLNPTCIWESHAADDWLNGRSK